MFPKPTSLLLFCLIGVGNHAGAILVTEKADNADFQRPTVATVKKNGAACETWCESKKHIGKGPNVMCQWGACSGCSACSTVDYANLPADCKYWCIDHTHDWTTKCNWNFCSGCGGCSTGSPTSAAPICDEITTITSGREYKGYVEFPLHDSTFDPETITIDGDLVIKDAVSELDIDLGKLEKITGDLVIKDNAKQVKITANALQSIGGSFIIKEMSGVSKVEIVTDNLLCVGEWVIIKDMTGAAWMDVSIEARRLQRVGGGILLKENTAHMEAEVDVCGDSTELVIDDSVIIKDNDAPANDWNKMKVDLQCAGRLGGSAIIKGNSKPTGADKTEAEIKMKYMDTIDGSLIIRDNPAAYAKIDADGLTAIGGSLSIETNTDSEKGKAEVKAKEVTSIGGSLTIADNTVAKLKVGLDMLSSLGGSLSISGNLKPATSGNNDWEVVAPNFGGFGGTVSVTNNGDTSSWLSKPLDSF